MNTQVKSILANGIVIIISALLLLLAATWWRMESQYAIGDAAFRKGDFTGALAGYESAIHMYIPFHPVIERSAERLWQLAELNERQGDITRALIAYRSLRSSFYAARWLVTPGTEWIAKCDKKIAALVPLQGDR